MYLLYLANKFVEQSILPSMSWCNIHIARFNSIPTFSGKHVFREIINKQVAALTKKKD